MIPSSARNALIAAFVLVAGWTTYTHILPSRIPAQKQLTPENLTGAYDDTDTLGMFHGTRAYAARLPNSQISDEVLGDTSDNKRIEVDLTNQRLYAFEGDTKVYDFVISSGLYDWTPRGEFRIWIKLRYTKMEGGVGANYYYLPNVPYTMFFYNDQIPKHRGFGLHGTYWHNDFGRPKSHGCVNLRTEDAEKLFYWATPHSGDRWSTHATADNPGTRIIIYGKYGG